VSHERGENPSALPSYISILSNAFLSPAAYSPGFLGPQFAPLQVGGAERSAAGATAPYGPPLEVRNSRLAEGVAPGQAAQRNELLQFVDQQFAADRPGLPTQSHDAAYQQAVRMMNSPAMSAFDLDEEPAALREAYGKNRFGQACLLARRLVERGVPFVEVALSSASGEAGVGWDTHQNNFSAIKELCGVLDPAWGTLLMDLKGRGLLESTTVAWMGEFGRTPAMNRMGGRDHFPGAWSTVLAGGGIRGGQVYGATSDSGMEVAANPVAVNQLMATLLAALQIDFRKQNMSAIGRPIRLAEPEVEPIAELLA
jgi:uncharacterized protein (DUF1501 family)